MSKGGEEELLNYQKEEKLLRGTSKRTDQPQLEILRSLKEAHL